MIKHIVMFKLKAEADNKTAYKNAEEAKEKLANFVESIPTLKSLEVGINAKGAPQENCELVLVCDFEDLDGLEAYRVHPVHVAFGKYITPLRESRACIDYEY